MQTSNAASLRCDSCGYEQAKQKAISAGRGEHFVFSVPDGRVTAFLVNIEPGLIDATPYPPPEVAIKAALGLQEIFLSSHGAMKARATQSATGLGGNWGTANAYDVVRDANLRAQLLDRLRDGSQPLSSVSANINALRAIANTLLGLTQEIELLLTVEFYDGTQIEVNMNLGRETSEYIARSGRTADGELIPDQNSASFAGRWTGDDLDRLRGHMESLGAGSTSLGSGRRIEWLECSWSNANTTLHCRIKWVDL